MQKNHPEFIVDVDDRNESLLIHDIARLMKKRFDKRAKTLSLTRSQWLALAALRRHPGIHQAELADKLDVEPMTVARLVDRLEEAGWLTRNVDPKDRRAKRLYLSERIQNTISQMRDMSLQTRTEAVLGITEDEHRTLVAILRKIKNNIVAQ